MSQSSFAASLLRSGYEVVDQAADRPALPSDYRVQVAKPLPSIEPRLATPSPSPYVPVGNCTFYSGGEEMLTKLYFYFTDSTVSSICGMKIGYPNDKLTKVMGRKTVYVRDWARQDGEVISIVTITSLIYDGRVSAVAIFSSIRGSIVFGTPVEVLVTDIHNAYFPVLYDFQTYYNSDCIIWMQHVGKYRKQYSGPGGQINNEDNDGYLTLVPRPCSMRLKADLAREVTGEITSGKWEELFNAKFKLGSDVSQALERLVDCDEEKAWTKYYDSKTNQVVYVCESDGDVYIWTRDIVTADAHEHITQIGYYSQDADLLVATEWSLAGTFNANDIQKTSLAYKSWFTQYVKDSTGAVRNVADQVLRDALVGAGVMTNKGVLKVHYGGAPSATGANVINSSIAGVWAILACEKFVKELVPKDYLVVDTLSFDQKYDWTQIVAEGDEDAISGEGGIVVIPKTETRNYIYPYDYQASSADITAFLTTNIFLKNCTTRRAFATFDRSKLVDTIGYVAIADDRNGTASVGITVLPPNEQGAQRQLATLKARSNIGSTSSPPAIIAAHKTAEGDPLRKISLLIGKYV